MGRTPAARPRARPGGSAGARAAGAVGCVVLVVMVALVAAGVVALVRGKGETVPGAQRCVATAAGNSVTVDPEQARLTAIIVGTAVRRGLPARAGSIAMATVYQESGIRNLDHGDRDSVGLFQQRPSQGWGTSRQLQDPYYATARFYDALVKVPNWRTGDINDVAQRVQRSGYPEAYRDHEADGRILASVFSGRSPGGLSCLRHRLGQADPQGLRDSMTRTLGVSRGPISDSGWTVPVSSTAQAWAVAHHAQANAARFGVTSVQVADRAWRHADDELVGWSDADPVGRRTVVIRFG